MTLRELKPGQSAKILSVGGEGALRQHFLDMGVLPEAVATLVQYAPMGDPMELTIEGYALTLRLDDAQKIVVQPLSEAEVGIVPRPLSSNLEHPGLGEGGKYHKREEENPVPRGTILRFALVGNQNCGKTTLFNRLTGSKQHVGNFPGVTVSRKDGAIKGRPDTQLTDLPGIYSMSPYSGEERVTRAFVLDERPHGIINIVDATNLSRNLYLTMQLLELDIPMVLALNMMDEVQENGGSILINELETQLGIPVIPISAARGDGVDELIEHAIHVARYQEKPLRQDFCMHDDSGGAVHRCLHGIVHLIEHRAQQANLPTRFAASKLIEGDTLIIGQLRMDEAERDVLERVVQQMERERKLDRAAAIADMRFRFIHRVCAATVQHGTDNRAQTRSRKLDSILTGKYTAIPVFIGIMALIFWLTFHVVGSFLQDLLALGIDAFTAWVDTGLTALGIDKVLHALIIDGIFAGVGGVLSFLPIILTLFFFLSLLEDSGYIARVAFVMDKLLRHIGLSGRSIVPMLVGFGCTVPAVMATRTLPSERDRKMTILLTPFMSCSAKLPVYAFFVEAFFPSQGAWVMVGLYLLGIVLGVVVALLLKKTLFRGEAVPFVMELPSYRLPGLKNVGQLLWEKAKDFLQKAFTVIFLASFVIWFLQSFDFGLRLVDDTQNSMLAAIAGILVPWFTPLGLGDWRLCTALVTGLLAKESVVSTLTVLFGSMQALHQAMNTAAAVSMVVFCLLYVPCVAAIGAIRRELGTPSTVVIAVWQCVLAWGVALAAHMLVQIVGIA